jgi:hypothetical protein
LEILERRAEVDFNPVCDPTTISYQLTGLVRGFVTGHGAISEAEADAWAADLRTVAGEDRYFFALNRYFYLLRRPA